MKRHRGMTLVELLIVFTIVGLLVSLVAPSSTKLLDKARAQEEWLVLDRTVDSLAFKAYAEAQYIELSANERTLQWTVGGKPGGALALAHLRFDKPQQVYINPNGLANVGEMSVMQADRQRTLRLNRWLESRR
jgi:prepilin-type N-terminal cleavage/methylation domain-containing protein